MEDTKLRRHWFRFSLRTLLVCTVLAGLLLGWVAKERGQSQRELRIAKDLQEKGWTVTLAGPFDLQRTKDQAWWRVLARRLLGDRIARLTSHDSRIDDLSPLTELSSLRCLTIRTSQINNFAPFAQLTYLEELSLNRSSIDDLSHLTRLKELQSLYISRTKVHDLSPLAHLTKLDYLNMSNTQVRDLTPLTGLPNFERLDMVGIDLSKEQIDNFRKAFPKCVIKGLRE